MRLHLGCGSNILEGYVNVDKFVNAPNIMKWDAVNIPLSDNSVGEIYCSQLLEHLSFEDEKKFFDEVFRLLKTGGELRFEVPDFEWITKQFIDANDNWKEFYKREDNHYFGHGYNMNEKWSVLVCHIFGNQSSDGQYHKNAYTAQKIEAILDYYGYSERMVVKYVYERFDLPCLRAIAIK